MADRDDFSEPTKRFVALRAGHHCSFPGCPQRTVGPSDESPTAVTNIGEAAHICAAAPGPGSRRYVESMSPEERSHIDNAVWLCATYARLIDRDSAIYTIECLRQMKRDHEAACAEEVRQPSSQSTRTYDLIPHFRDELFSTNLRLLSFISIYACLNAVKTPRRYTPRG